MPDFGRIDPMPMRAFAFLQQKIDRGGMRTFFLERRVAQGLAEMPALGMRLELQDSNDPIGRFHCIIRPQPAGAAS